MLLGQLIFQYGNAANFLRNSLLLYHGSLLAVGTDGVSSLIKSWPTSIGQNLRRKSSYIPPCASAYRSPSAVTKSKTC